MFEGIRHSKKSVNLTTVVVWL